MADKLDWMGKHLVLIRYLTIADAVEQGKYEKRPDLAKFYEEVEADPASAEALVFKFIEAGEAKCACDFMAYIAHKRAAVWWAYRCLISLYEELKENPAVERDIADIGANFSVKVPDFAKIDLPKPDESAKATLNAAIAKVQAQSKEISESIDPEMLAYVQEAVEIAFQEFKKVHGIHPIDLIKKLGSRINENQNPIDPKSPLFLEAAKLKAQLQAVQKETVATIKAAIPPKAPAHEKKLRDNALDAVWRWIAAPDKENTQKCFEAGTACQETPAGLLALTAFWSFGDMMPLGAQPVPTPPGLSSNGVVQVLMKCALNRGGVRKAKERYALYCNLGIEVLTGKENWADSLAESKAPHAVLAADNAAPPSPPSNETERKDQDKKEYARWK
jgi:hypothetical protein